MNRRTATAIMAIIAYIGLTVITCWTEDHALLPTPTGWPRALPSDNRAVAPSPKPQAVEPTALPTQPIPTATPTRPPVATKRPEDLYPIPTGWPRALPSGSWYKLGVYRITYYDPERYHDGDPTASGQLYNPAGWTAALGPALLDQAREIACEPWPVIAIVSHAKTLVVKVNDTGSPALEVDLPYDTWAYFGEPHDVGVITGAVFVRVAEGTALGRK